MLEHLDNELGRQLRQEGSCMLPHTQGRGGRGGGSGEERLEHTRMGGGFSALLSAEEPRSGGALAGGGAESVESGVGHAARAVPPSGIIVVRAVDSQDIYLLVKRKIDTQGCSRGCACARHCASSSC
jgi:hypothetical protein